MSKFEDCTFSDSEQVLDGSEFERCTFENCTLIYRGGPVPAISGCTFHGGTILFEGPALDTLRFMSGVYHGLPGGREFIEQMFERIRTGT